jgi:hypothetical protein
MVQLNFDASDVPPDDRNFDLLPAGIYHVQIIESAMVPTKAGTGYFLKLTFEVLDGPYANRKLWDQLNIENVNEKTQEIAKRSLASLCRLLDLVHVSDSEELHFKPFHIQVGVRKDKNGFYPPQNQVRYAKLETAPPNTPAAPPPRQQARPASARQPARSAPVRQAAPPQAAAAPAAPAPAPAPQRQAAPPAAAPAVRNNTARPWAQPRQAPPQRLDPNDEIPF